ncbi:MAG: peptidoglycan-binding protein, partial [Steroidobacterales bacterium]
LTLLIVGASAALLWRLTPVRTAIAQLHALPARATAGATVAPTPAGLPASAVSSPATTAAAKPATAAAPALSALLADQRAQTGTDAAFAQLFSIWRASYQPGRLDACTQAATQGLRCLSERGSFAQLRQFNRPAILSLSDEAGMSYQALLTGFEDDTARLQFGTASATVGIAELARYWSGDFVLLWRPPTKDVKDLAAGMRGPQVRNLREQLQRWRGETAPAASGDEFDAALMEQVAEFQRSAHLAVDGVAGIETQVALDAALAAPDTPLLRHTAVASAAAQAQHLPGPTEIR